MTDFKLDGLRREAQERIGPFLREVLEGYSENVQSIHVVGSSVTEDFDPKTSDVNSIFVLKKMDLKFLEVLAPRGKKYGKMGVAAPLIMTNEYISNSLDVFPIEFLNIRLIHETVYGEDVFSDIEIQRRDLRRQCEREIKAKLIGLRQGYIASAGDARVVLDKFVSAITGYIPLFRGIIYLCQKRPPALNVDVLGMLTEVTGVNCEVFDHVLRQRRHREKLGIGELNKIFEKYYESTEKLGKFIDEISL